MKRAWVVIMAAGVFAGAWGTSCSGDEKNSDAGIDSGPDASLPNELRVDLAD